MNQEVFTFIDPKRKRKMQKGPVKKKTENGEWGECRKNERKEERKEGRKPL